MITCGIDVGSKTVKVVIMENGQKILARAITLTGFDQDISAEKGFNEALKTAGIDKDKVEKITATGAGRKVIYQKGPIGANAEVTEVTAAAKGAVFYFPMARTVIDVGAEEGRGIRCDESGRVIDFAVNEKCAAGAGAFTEAMARALDVSLEEFGNISLSSQKTIPINAQCAVFAESEVVSLVHSQIAKADIARAVHDAIANRIVSMVRRVGVEKEIILVGGVAKNVGFVESLKRTLEVDNIFIPGEPEYVGAVGAALIASGK